MKKIIALIIAIFSLLALTGCGHRHTVDEWSVNPAYHWHKCPDCGESIDKSAHEEDKDGICIVCNSSVILNDNGNILVTVYDNEGNVLRELVFDENGNIIN